MQRSSSIGRSDMSSDRPGRRVGAQISLSLDGRVNGPGGEVDMSWVARHAVSDVARGPIGAGDGNGHDRRGGSDELRGLRRLRRDDEPGDPALADATAWLSNHDTCQ
jgi:hypothetical protein